MRIDLIVSSVLASRTGQSRLRASPVGPLAVVRKSPAAVRARTNGIAVLLGWRGRISGAGSAGSPFDVRHVGIVPFVYHDAVVGVGLAGRLSGEVTERRGIAGSG